MNRAAVYSTVGVLTEVVFSAAHDAIRRRTIRLRTSAWMFPIYALVQPLYEPLHDAVRPRPRWQRAATYAAGFLAVEYASGAALRRIHGRAPWDYSDTRWHVNGLIRPDYAAFWAVAGLALEPLHDRLTGRRTREVASTSPSLR